MLNNLPGNSVLMHNLNKIKHEIQPVINVKFADFDDRI